MNIYQTQSEGRILNAIQGSLLKMGFEVARVKIMKGRSETLQVMIERIDGKPITVGDCEYASRQISAVMDVEDPIDDKYRLEVSSVGLDRPLTREKDFYDNIGQAVKIIVYNGINGRRKFKGQMTNVEDKKVLVKVDEEVFAISFENIQEANLVSHLVEKNNKK